MKAKKRTLFILLALLVLAGAALALLTALNNKAAASSAAADSIQLTSYAADAMESISYVHDGAQIALKETDGTWALADDAAYHVNQTLVNSMVTALTSLSARRSLGEADAASYGLDAPSLTVTAQVSGSSFTVTFGDTNSVTGDIYLQISGDPAVYTVDAAKENAFAYGKTELYDTGYTPVTISRSDIAGISYRFEDGTEDFNVNLEAESEPAASAASSDSASASDSAVQYETVWYLAQDGASLDQSKIEEMISQLTAAPTAQNTNPGDLAQYGLANPIITVQLTAADGTQQQFSLGIGTDNFYMMAEGDNSVYTVTVDLLNAFSSTADELKSATASAASSNALEGNAFSTALNGAS